MSDQLVVVTNNQSPLVVVPGRGVAGPPGPPGSGSSIAAKDESISLGSVTGIDFRGAGVSVTLVGSDARVDIPGGDVALVATTAALAALTPADGDLRVMQENGREGLFEFFSVSSFNARYGSEPTLVAAVAADTLNGVYVAPASDTTGASGAWVRREDKLDPRMFGGVTNYQTGNRVTMVPPYGESSTPGSTNGILVDSRAACQALLDIIAAHENRRFIADFSGGIWGISTNGSGNALEFRVPYHKPRRFIGGQFRGIGAGTNLFYVRDVTFSIPEGYWNVRSGHDGGSIYGWPARQWENGIWLRNAGQSLWDFVHVSGFKRFGVQYDPIYDLDLEDYNNNIGQRFQKLYATGCGSRGGTAGYEFTIGFTASSRTGSAGAAAQRTVLTLAAGHEILRVGDIIKSPAGSYHQISEKTGADISVHPWIISTAGTGTITSCHGGGVQCTGKDVAGAGADSLTTIICGAGLDLNNSLHGTVWGDAILEAGAIGMVVGTLNGIGGLGHTVSHVHCEAVVRDLISVGGQNVGLQIGSASAWAAQDYSDPFKLCETLAANDGTALETATGLPWVALFIEGEWHTTGTTYGDSVVKTKSRAFIPNLTNNPAHNHIRKVADSLSVTLKYFEASDRTARNKFAARLEVTGTGGGAPTGAITVTLNAADVTAGIQFMNGTTSSTYVVAAGAATGPVILDFWLDTNGATKRWVVLDKSVVEGGAVSTQTGTSYTAALTDANDYIEFTNGSAVNFTIPPNASVAFPIKTVIEIEQAGAGALTVVAGAGVTINSRGGDLTLAGQYAVAALKKKATDTWTLTGDL